MISVGIVGASGYTGEELVKLLNHPDVSLDVLTSGPMPVSLLMMYII